MNQSDVDLRLPSLFKSTLIIRAFDGLRCNRTIISMLKEMGAVEIEGTPKLCDPEVIRANMPSIYHRCVELLLEDRLKAQVAVSLTARAAATGEANPQR